MTIFSPGFTRYRCAHCYKWVTNSLMPPATLTIWPWAMTTRGRQAVLRGRPPGKGRTYKFCPTCARRALLAMVRT